MKRIFCALVFTVFAFPAFAEKWKAKTFEHPLTDQKFITISKGNESELNAANISFKCNRDDPRSLSMQYMTYEPIQFTQNEHSLQVRVDKNKYSEIKIDTIKNSYDSNWNKVHWEFPSLNGQNEEIASIVKQIRNAKTHILLAIDERFSIDIIKIDGASEAAEEMIKYCKIN